jgi:hypothetical protein
MPKLPKKKKPTHFQAVIRTYADGLLAHVWINEVVGATIQGRLHGTMFKDQALALVETLDIEYRVEEINTIPT